MIQEPNQYIRENNTLDIQNSQFLPILTIHYFAMAAAELFIKLFIAREFLYWKGYLHKRSACFILIL
jgi:hypothetical protein